MALLDKLANASPELIWGLLSRGVGLVYLVSFASLSFQVIPTAGKIGITPISESLRAIERHFPGWKRFFYFPSLLWVNDSDVVLRGLPWLGMIASGCIIVGGEEVPWMFAIAYLVYLSLDRPMILVYPWDCLLFEAGFWGMLLPATRLLPEVGAIAAPLPAVAWVFRLLVFRLTLGFGKHKFVGTTPSDAGFLKGFLVNQPLPTPPGWLAQKMPMWLLRVGLGVMFVVEVLLPAAVFFPGRWSVIGGVAIIGLMVAIWITGNFGYFNLALIVVTLSWFDTKTASAFRMSALFSLQGPVFIHALVVLHTLCALCSFPFNTFCAHTWMLWPWWSRVRPRFLTWPVTVIRLLHPLRWVHAYGVFPPHTPPSVKIVPVVEVSWGGEDWHALQHRFSPTLETSPPRLCAPHHARFDQAVVYEGIGLNEASMWRNIVGRWDPYGYGGVPAARMFVHRVLDGTIPGSVYYDRALEKKRGPPLLARVRTHMLEPRSLEDLRRTGRWWRRTLIGPHFPPVKRGDAFWQASLPAPELWHPDDVVWLRRSHLGALMKRAASGESPHDLVLVGADDIAAADVTRFWSEFLPGVGARHDWTGVRQMVDRIRSAYGAPALRRFERIAARYGVLLAARLEPLLEGRAMALPFGLGTSTAKVKTWHHLRLLASHVLSEGRERYDAVAADPSLGRAEAERMTMQSGNYLQVLFRYEAVLYQCQKLRLDANFIEYDGRPELTEKERRVKEWFDALVSRLWGSVEVVAFLTTQLKGPEDVLDIPESWPRFRMTETGEVKPVDRAAPGSGTG
jgi:Lipase maturation factor